MIASPSEESLALSRAAADHRRAADRFSLGLHAARALLAAGRASRLERALHQGRFGQPSDALVQGSRRVGGGDAREGARLRGPGVRVDRQPRQLGVGARRASRHGVLRVHPRQPRGREAARLGDLRPDDSRHRRQLRRCEPVVHAGGRSLRLGIREHQPALVLRRRREDDGIRDRRAAGLALSRRIWCRRSPAARCCRESCAGSASCERSVSSTASCRTFMPRRRRAARRS